MRRTISMILFLFLLFSLTGCAGNEEIKCTFYYLRTDETIDYGTSAALIAPVVRGISNQNTQLNYLLRLYLNGPLPENYRSPFPAGTYLLNTQIEGDTLVVVLSEEFSTLTDIPLALACACLCSTCFDLTEAECIHILSAGQTYTFDRSSFLLLDDITPTD